MLLKFYLFPDLVLESSVQDHVAFYNNFITKYMAE
jgi:hypothetical protein